MNIAQNEVIFVTKRRKFIDVVDILKFLAMAYVGMFFALFSLFIKA